MTRRTRNIKNIIGAIMALFLCITGGIYMTEKRGEVFVFDLGDPTENTSEIHYTKCKFNFSEEEIQEILKTIPEETLKNYGLDKGTDTPESADKEGALYAARLKMDESAALTRMTREGYTCTDKADFYDWSHGKWSSRGGKRPAFIIPHHMAGNLTPAQFYAIMHSSRQMSPTVSVHTDGTVYAWVPEEMRPWTTGSYMADQDALTLEIANDEIGGDWHISDTAYYTAVAICAEWCKRYGIDPYWKPGAMGTIQEHKQWAQTACPGPYLSRKIESGQFEADIRAILNPPKPQPTPTPGKAKYRVQVGAFKSKENAEVYRKVIKARTKIEAILKQEGGYYKVQCGAFASKENAEAMVNRLKAAGFPAIIKNI